MSNPLWGAERCDDLAEKCRRIAALDLAREAMKGLLSISVATASLTHAAAVLAQQAPLFTITDLGSLGGFSDAAAINEGGHVIGRSATPAGDIRGYFWTAERGMIDIGTLGGTLSYPLAINDNDEVVGYSQIGSGAACLELPCTHGFLWTTKTGMIDLGTVDSETVRVVPLSINNRGEVVGYYHTFSQGRGVGHGIERPFLWTAKTGMIDLGSLPGDIAGAAAAINRKGEVIGSSYNCSVGTSCRGQFPHPVLWTVNKVRVGLGTLGGESAFASAINDRGEITGGSETAIGPDGTSGNHAFLWTARSGMRDLGALGAQNSNANAINDRGEIVGTYWSDTGPVSETRAFLWTQYRGMIDLGTFGGAFTYPAAINDRGEVVGSSNRAEFVDGIPVNRAFYWRLQAGMTDLGTLVNGRYSDAVGINRSGQILGDSDRGEGNFQHAVLWTPRQMVDDLKTAINHGPAGSEDK